MNTPLPDPGQLPDYHGGVIAGLITAITALILGVAEYVRRHWIVKGTAISSSQLDRIENMLNVLIRTLVVATEDGGHTTVSKQLAKGLHDKLDGIEKQLARRVPQRTQEHEKINELCRNVESLSEAVMSAVEIMRDDRGVR